LHEIEMVVICAKNVVLILLVVALNFFRGVLEVPLPARRSVYSAVIHCIGTHCNLLWHNRDHNILPGFTGRCERQSTIRDKVTAGGNDCSGHG